MLSRYCCLECGKKSLGSDGGVRLDRSSLALKVKESNVQELAQSEPNFRPRNLNGKQLNYK